MSNRKPHSEETKRKISQSEKGKTVSEAQRKNMSLGHMGVVSPNKGKTFSKEWRDKMSKARIGKISPLIGRKQTPEHIAKRTMRGDKNPSWRGGVTPIHEIIRKSAEYKLWRKACYERDNYTCIFCGAKGKVHADHIKPFCLFPELRFAIDNGRTLCVDCHRKTDTWGKKALTYKNNE